MTDLASCLVSVPLCVYNGERFLKQQLDSVLQQTHAHLEIRVFDDCSTDGSWEILTDYAQKDRRILITRNPENLGFIKNFSQAIAACAGEFVAPCDQDDIWLPKKLARLLHSLGHADMVYSDSVLVDQNGKSLERRMSDLVNMCGGHDPLMLVFNNCVSGHAMLFRRTLLADAMPIPSVYFHDHWLAIVALASGGLRYLDETLVCYRQHDTNVTDVVKKRGRVLDRSPGYKLRKWHIAGEKLEAVNRLLKSRDSDICVLAKMWRRHEVSWFSPRLSWATFRNRHRLYALYPRSAFSILQEMRRMFVGIKLRRIFDARGYCQS